MKGCQRGIPLAFEMGDVVTEKRGLYFDTKFLYFSIKIATLIVAQAPKSYASIIMNT